MSNYQRTSDRARNNSLESKEPVAVIKRQREDGSDNYTWDYASNVEHWQRTGEYTENLGKVEPFEVVEVWFKGKQIEHPLLTEETESVIDLTAPSEPFSLTEPVQPLHFGDLNLIPGNTYTLRVAQDGSHTLEGNFQL